MQSSEQAIGVDIGGTKILAALVDPAGTIIRQIHRPTPTRDVPATERAIVDLVQELGGGDLRCPVGVGAAGWMNRDSSRVLFSPHLSWRDEPVRDRLEAQLGRSVTLVNDADAAGWAEYRFGAARGVDDVVCLTLGTGIGGSIILKGEVYHGSSGIAGEFGHQTIVPDGHRCACGNRGCWEQYASGNALGRHGAELVRSKSPVAHNLREACHDDPSAVTGALVTELAVEGDPACRDLIEEMGQWLGLGISNLVSVLDPGMVVIGGGLGSAHTELLAVAEAHYRRTLSGRGYRPFARICRAQLGPTAGLIGAADLACQHSR